MATGEPQTSSAVRVPAEPEIAAVQVIGQEALAELDVPVAQVELEALAGLEDQVVPVVRAALVVPEDQVVPAVRAALVVPENQVAPVGLAVRVAPVALANQAALAVRVAPVALANRVGLAVRVAPVALANRVALELVPVVAVPVLDQVEAQRRTRSATAAHHRGQVPVRAVEDLAAAVETTREPAATEVVVVWAVAG